MRYKLVIFDMDGTILDTLADLTDCLNYALSFFGYPKRTVDEVRSFVGNGIRKLVERGLPQGVAASDTDNVHLKFKEYYAEHFADKTKPYDGIPKLLAALRASGVKTAVVSNKADFAVQKLVLRYFSGLFDAAVGEREGVNKKPAPDSVFEAVRSLRFRLSETLYVGDSDVDVQTAQNAGVDSLLVLWGFRDEDVLRKAGASNFARTPADILNAVLGN